MTLPTIGTPMGLAYLEGSGDDGAWTLPNVTVSGTGKLLLVILMHEGNVGESTPTSAKWGGPSGDDLTEIVRVGMPSGLDALISIWAIANPAPGTDQDVVINFSGPEWECTITALEISGADLSSGLASAIDSTGSNFLASGGSALSLDITTASDNALIIDAGLINQPSRTYTATAGQTHVAGGQQSLGTAWAWEVGQLDGGTAGAKTLSYGLSGSYGRFAYAAIAIKEAGAGPTLGNLSIDDLTAATGVAWSAAISGRTAGSTITAVSSDGTTLTVDDGLETVSGAFSAAGTPTVTLTETLAGATNSPRDSPGQTVTVSSAPTLDDLSIDDLSAEPGVAWSANISGRTAGSTITAVSSDGTTLTVDDGLETVSGTFSAAGTPTVTLTETLAGATNSPHDSPGQTVTVAAALTRIKVAVLGSSTPAKWFDDSTTETANPNIRRYDGSSWAALTNGLGAIAFANKLLDDLGPGYGVDFIDQGSGGTTLSTWAGGGSNYSPLVTQITAVGGVDMAICHVGSNDARANNVASVAAHETYYRALIANLRTDVSDADLPFIIMGCQRNPGGAGSPGNDIYWDRARSAEMNVADDADNVLGSTVVDLPIAGDNIHLSTGETGGSATSARRVAQAVHSVLFGGTERYTGPVPGGSTYDAGTGWMRINFAVAPGTQLVGGTGQSGLTGFTFFANGVPVTPVVEPFVSSTAQVAAQLATGLSSVSYAYQSGQTPDVGNALFDNGPVPAEPA